MAAPDGVSYAQSAKVAAAYRRPRCALVHRQSTWLGSPHPRV